MCNSCQGRKPHRPARLPAALLAIVLAACGADLGPFPVADTAPGERIFHGRVLLAEGDRLTPLGGVSLVCFWPGGRRRVVTDDDGSFSVRGLRPGPWRLRVRHPHEGDPAYEGTFPDGRTEIEVVLR